MAQSDQFSGHNPPLRPVYILNLDLIDINPEYGDVCTPSQVVLGGFLLVIHQTIVQIIKTAQNNGRSLLLSKFIKKILTKAMLERAGI